MSDGIKQLLKEEAASDSRDKFFFTASVNFYL